MRNLKIEYETDTINARMENALIYLLNIFGWRIDNINFYMPLCSKTGYRLLFFKKKDN